MSDPGKLGAGKRAAGKLGAGQRGAAMGAGGNRPAARRLGPSPRLGAVVAAFGGAAAAPVVARRRWRHADDPTGGSPLDLPLGRETTVVTGDGAELAVWEAGPAHRPPVVAAHGWTGDRRVWAATARRLVASGHRVILYDQRGHGASLAGRDGLSMDALADDLRSVLEAADARHAVVAGHSMGGMAAQTFALRHTDVLADRVAALVLVSTTCQEVMRGGPFDRVAMWCVTSPLAHRVASNRQAGPFVLRLGVGRRPVWSHLVATQETYMATSPEVRGGFLRAMAALDLAGELGSLTVPTIIVSGTLDTLTPHRQSRRMAEIIPGAQLVAIPGAGHQLVFEHPDRLAAILGDAVASPPDGLAAGVAAVGLDDGVVDTLGRPTPPARA